MSHTLWGIKAQKKKTKINLKKIARANLKQKLAQEKKCAFRGAENLFFCCTRTLSSPHYLRYLHFLQKTGTG